MNKYIFIVLFLASVMVISACVQQSPRGATNEIPRDDGGVRDRSPPVIEFFNVDGPFFGGCDYANCMVLYNASFSDDTGLSSYSARVTGQDYGFGWAAQLSGKSHFISGELNLSKNKTYTMTLTVVDIKNKSTTASRGFDTII